MPNRLNSETSPYLLQHADNPVDWQPWDEQALAQAVRENKPILLSIGYSACHWCHVMAHESFEDKDTAAIMNRHFINIKVDREERPDLDKIYQTAYQLIAQRTGGWPLTMFLTPDNRAPFFGGTYFPPGARHGLPGFPELLNKVRDFYDQQGAQVAEHSRSVQRQLERLQSPSGKKRGTLDAGPLNTARQQLEQNFDSQDGGFGQAPKFPHVQALNRLLRHYALTAQQGEADQDGLDIALFSLDKMARGGIYDHIGGGFCRYSTDARWMIPHFEKMLYDNGPLLEIYSAAWQVQQNPLFRQVALETADWCLREMQSPAGGFYSSLDADSEGEEGRFYVWDTQEIKDLLEPDTYRVFAAYAGLDKAPNFEGRRHVWMALTPEQLAQQTGLSTSEVNKSLSDARRLLFEAREKRVAPGRDDKILTAWNALVIKGLAAAGMVFGRDSYIRAADKALDFIREQLWDGERLFAVHKDGKSRFNAYLDDYAFLLDAILHLLQARWRDGDLAFAIQLAECLLQNFADESGGGFYFTSHDHEQLLQRPKNFGDDSIPSGNGVAAYALQRLGHLTGNADYLRACENTLHAAWPLLIREPYAYNSLLCALEEHLFPPQQIILRGAANAQMHEEWLDWQSLCRNGYTPRRICFAIPAETAGLPGVMAAQKAQREMTAYICRGSACLEPVTKREQLQNLL